MREIGRRSVHIKDDCGLKREVLFSCFALLSIVSLIDLALLQITGFAGASRTMSVLACDRLRSVSCLRPSFLRCANAPLDCVFR